MAKYCKACDRTKPDIEFHKSKEKRDGLCTWCKPCTNAYYKRLRLKQPEVERAKNRRFRKSLRDDVLDTYGAICVCCGEANRGFLTLDHIDGGGGKHRKARGSSLSVYIDVRNAGFPKDLYRILCYNCNTGRAHNGGVCPHEEARG